MPGLRSQIAAGFFLCASALLLAVAILSCFKGLAVEVTDLAANSSVRPHAQKWILEVERCHCLYYSMAPPRHVSVGSSGGFSVWHFNFSGSLRQPVTPWSLWRFEIIQLQGVARLTAVLIPVWVIPSLSLLLLVLPILHARARRRLKHRRATNRCQQCGYDLRASAGRCPECGDIIPIPGGALAPQSSDQALRATAVA